MSRLLAEVGQHSVVDADLTVLVRGLYWLVSNLAGFGRQMWSDAVIGHTRLSKGVVDDFYLRSD